MDSGMKLAVLIDAENISGKYIKTILDEASNNGNIIIKRIYGNWTNNQMASWKEVILDNSIQPIQQYSNTVGKNSTDSALIIDAMDLLYSGRIEGFCIISSDSDFTRLAARLRESEKFVLGMGELKTPKSFINACDKFSYLDILYSENGKADKPDAAKTEKKESAGKAPESPAVKQDKRNGESGADRDYIVHTIKALIDEHSDDDGWIYTGLLGNLLMKRFPDFDSRNFGYTKLSTFLASLDMFQVKRTPSEENPKSKLVYVRNK